MVFGFFFPHCLCSPQIPINFSHSVKVINIALTLTDLYYERASYATGVLEAFDSNYQQVLLEQLYG